MCVREEAKKNCGGGSTIEKAKKKHAWVGGGEKFTRSVGATMRNLRTEKTCSLSTKCRKKNLTDQRKTGTRRSTRRLQGGGGRGVDFDFDTGTAFGCGRGHQSTRTVGKGTSSVERSGRARQQPIGS